MKTAFVGRPCRLTGYRSTKTFCWRVRSTARRCAGLILLTTAGVAPGEPPLSPALSARLNPPRIQLNPDYTVRIPTTEDQTAVFTAAGAGKATVLIRGLRLGGAVQIDVNNAPPDAVELWTTGGLTRPAANAALVTASVFSGRNEVRVTESDGVQVVRLWGTNRWCVVSTFSGGKPMLSLDTNDLTWQPRQYPICVYYGPDWESFLWFSGRWDVYYSDVLADSVTKVRGTSGAREAVLSYTLECPRRNLITPTQLTVTPDPLTGAFTVRVRQLLRATGQATLQGAVQFLHVKVSPADPVDWQDGVTDYVWYRSQTGDCPDAAPGSYTGMARLDDNSSRVYAYRCSTTDPGKTATSTLHHTGATVLLPPRNAIGGFFTKTGVGSCAWVFHQYEASFRSDLQPVFSHCGDGADPHFLLCAGEMYNPVTMSLGDRVIVDYSLTMLTSEVAREDIEDLNEADLHIFGHEPQQRSKITGWIGNKQAVGLTRSDGSVLLLGIGRQPGRTPVPGISSLAPRSIYRVRDLARPEYESVDVADGAADVLPGWLTVIDCGSALSERVTWQPLYASAPQPSWEEILGGTRGSMPIAASPPLPSVPQTADHPKRRPDIPVTP